MTAGFCMLPWQHQEVCPVRPRHIIASLCDSLDIVTQAAIRDVVRSGPGLTRAIAQSVVQTVLLVGSFFVMSGALGLSGPAIRGDLLIYLMTGVFLFNLHARTIMAVLASEGSTSEIRMYRASPLLMTIGSAIGALYVQIITALLLLFAYHVFWKAIDLRPLMNGLTLLGILWIGSIGAGQVLLAVKKLAPRLAMSLAQAWTRVAMLTSGSMFVANALPAKFIPLVSWNPLFHVIDQMRGAVFVNYSCQVSSPTTPAIAALCAIIAGTALYHAADTLIPHSRAMGA